MFNACPHENGEQRCRIIYSTLSFKPVAVTLRPSFVRYPFPFWFWLGQVGNWGIPNLEILFSYQFIDSLGCVEAG